MHVSIASVLGDVSSYVGPSSEERRLSAPSISEVGEGVQKDESGGDRPDVESSSSDEEDSPLEVCVPVGVVACKAGTTLFEAPLLPDR